MGDIYRVALFEREGFERKRCSSCGRTFWTLDAGRKTCGDTPCDEYGFIGSPPTKRRYVLPEVEEAFLEFFGARGHEVIPRYPVVARWREDIFLTIASIAPFQPWVTSGLVPPPANPLVVSQPSIRLKDIDNVGRSGRHFTLFFMGGHHAFNTRTKRVYWNDETVEYCHEFLTWELGIRAEEISYIQDFWEGGGNAGEDFEVNVRGLELATLVFMRYAGEGGKYRPIPLRIVDTGYGLERIAWISQGTPSSYEAIFAPIITQLRKIAGVEMPPIEVLRENCKLAGLIDIETGRDLRVLRSRVASRTGLSEEELDRMLSPLEAIYAVADHLRCLAFMFGDGITPSNVQAGYLARLVLRRTLRLMRELGLKVPLAELVALELKQLTPRFRELREGERYILEAVELEERRYRETIAKGSRLVERLVKGRERLPAGELVALYDTHGLPPEVVKEVASGLGVRAEVPEDFYIRVAKLHAGVEHPAKVAELVPRERLRKLPPTRALYYEDPYAREFEARVLRCIDGYVVLDRTAFYPEGGGQPADVGVLASKGREFRVGDVQKVGEVIVHKLEGKPKLGSGQKVVGWVDWRRRGSLMRHHTATHVLLGAARQVLGTHVWQHGVQKGVDRTRLDVTHFRRISDEELEEIERLANRVVMDNRGVSTSFMDRNEAERKHGLVLYQGGVVPGKRVRVVDVERWNTQACAGTHCSRTGEVGLIKIIRTERIQDGVERVEFAAGEAALDFVRQQERELARSAAVLRATPERVGAATQQLFEQWKAAEKELAKLRARVAELRLSELKARAKQIGKLKLVYEVIEAASVDELIQTASTITRAEPAMVVALGMRDGVANVAVMAGREAVRAGVDCGKLAAAAASILGGGGGGKPELGQGGGPSVGKLEEALAEVARLLLAGVAKG